MVQGFNGFTHNPIAYARQVKCPALILQGKLDKWTAVAEINQIFQNLRGSRQLTIFPNTGHNLLVTVLLVTVDQKRWQQRVDSFLKGISQ